jgi:hypothetical protein
VPIGVLFCRLFREKHGRASDHGGCQMLMKWLCWRATALCLVAASPNPLEQSLEESLGSSCLMQNDVCINQWLYHSPWDFLSNELSNLPNRLITLLHKHVPEQALY